MPFMPGVSSCSAASTPRVTSDVLAPGNFSTTSINPGPSLSSASPISGWLSSTTVATSRSGMDVPCTGTSANVSGLDIGEMWRTPRR